MLPRLALAILTLTLTGAGCGPGAARPAPTPTPAPEPVVRVSGSGEVLPFVRKVAEAYARVHPAARLEFPPGTNATGGIRGVSEGNLELAVASRPLTPAEAALAVEYRPFAREAIVFVVGLPNPVETLSTAQIRDIYGGSLTTWDQVGGAARPIVVLDRDPDEAVRRLVLIPLLEGRPVQARTTVLTSARDMVQALEITPNSLGYTLLGLPRVLEAKNVRTLALDGMVPDQRSPAEGSYPLRVTLGVIHGHDAGPATRGFVDFLVGSGGRQVLEAYGLAAVEG